MVFRNAFDSTNNDVINFMRIALLQYLHDKPGLHVYLIKVLALITISVCFLEDAVLKTYLLWMYCWTT